MKKHIIFNSLWLIILFFSACKSDTTPPLESLDFTIVPGERIGLITLENCTKEAVLEAYGTWAKEDSIYLIDGVWDKGVVIFPDDPKRRLEVFWDAEINPNCPAFLRVVGNGDLKDPTVWKTADGISLGSSLADVEKANGRPFEMFGFGQEYPGAVTDWMGGKLDLKLGITFQAPERVAMPDRVLQADVVNSADSLLQTITLVVSALDVRFDEVENQ